MPLAGEARQNGAGRPFKLAISAGKRSRHGPAGAAREHPAPTPAGSQLLAPSATSTAA